jgi:hypothetical protein
MQKVSDDSLSIVWVKEYYILFHSFFPLSGLKIGLSIFLALKKLPFW